MKIANLDGRLALVVGDGIVDVAIASDGRFGPEPMSVYTDWDSFTQWASGIESPSEPLDTSVLRCPTPMPRQVFAIGLNYRAHAEESGMDIPAVPAAFTKFPASLSGPFDDIEIVGDTSDWEVELVAVIGRTADRVAEADGWDHVAGLTIGQDISDRALQFAAGSQFSLGKSRRGYGPMGPWIVTPDEFPNRDDISIGCSVDGVQVQQSSTSDLVFSVPQLVAELSDVCPLYPGDIIFTGTPAGIGITRQPPQFLHPGSKLVSWADGIGEISNQCVEPPS